MPGLNISSDKNSRSNNNGKDNNDGILGSAWNWLTGKAKQAYQYAKATVLPEQAAASVASTANVTIPVVSNAPDPVVVNDQSRVTSAWNWMTGKAKEAYDYAKASVMPAPADAPVASATMLAAPSSKSKPASTSSPVVPKVQATESNNNSWKWNLLGIVALLGALVLAFKAWGTAENPKSSSTSNPSTSNPAASPVFSRTIFNRQAKPAHEKDATTQPLSANELLVKRVIQNYSPTQLVSFKNSVEANQIRGYQDRLANVPHANTSGWKVQDRVAYDLGFSGKMPRGKDSAYVRYSP